jgi:hypothetical protein
MDFVGHPKRSKAPNIHQQKDTVMHDTSYPPLFEVLVVLVAGVVRGQGGWSERKI